MIHLADHYEKQPKSIPILSRSLGVRGLLKQAIANFNVNKAWKELVGDESNVDRAVSWSKESAISLRQRLEYHDGTPEQLAADAFRLAYFTTKPHSTSLSWTNQAPTPPVQVPPMNPNIEAEAHSLSFETGTRNRVSSSSVAMTDVEMHSTGTKPF